MKAPKSGTAENWTPIELSFDLIQAFCANSHEDALRLERLRLYENYIAGIACLRNAYLSAPDGIVVDSDNGIHEYLNWFSGKNSHRIDKLKRVAYQALSSKGNKTPEILRGKTLSLMSQWGNINWGHYLLDSIGRLSVLHKSGLSLEGFDQVIVPKFPGKHAEILNRKLFPSQLKVIAAVEQSGFLVEELTVPTIPGYNRIYSSELPNFYREFAEVSTNYDRIFIPRDESPRRLIVGNQFRNHLDQEGFITVNPIALDTPWDAFTTANLIVGVHGAAMSGLVFAKSRSKFVEIAPNFHRYPYFESVAISAGMRSEIYYGSSGKLRDFLFSNSFLKAKSSFRIELNENDYENILK